LQYDLREPNVIVLDAGVRRRIVPVADLADYDYTPTLAGRAKVLRRFCGEQALSTALQNLCRPVKAWSIFSPATASVRRTTLIPTQAILS